VAVKYKDYYKILGVARNATEKEIKAAYRKLARQHHPDANQGDKKAEDKIKEINEAYEVLKDAEKRKRFDMLGSDWKNGAEFRPPPDMGFDFDFSNMGGFHGGGSPFSDFFDILFGEGFGGGMGMGPGSAGTYYAGPRGQAARGSDQEAEVTISLEEAAHGTTRKIEVSAPGKKKRVLEVKIPPGVRTGSKVRMGGEGGAGAGAGKRGDLFLKIRLAPHHLYKVEGDNLVSEVKITPGLAVHGGEASVATIDGKVTLTIPPRTQSGKVLRLRNKGLPKLKQAGRGDHLVKAQIVIPENMSETEKHLYEQLAKQEKQGK
jgi:curved DNA-binding protein